MSTHRSISQRTLYSALSLRLYTVRSITGKKSPHYLLLALAVDGTFLTQINTDSWFIMALGVLEIVLLAAAAVFALRASKAKKAELAQKSDNSDDDDDHTPPKEDKRNAVEAAFDD